MISMGKFPLSLYLIIHLRMKMSGLRIAILYKMPDPQASFLLHAYLLAVRSPIEILA
jgi:hypothetical protein